MDKIKPGKFEHCYLVENAFKPWMLKCALKSQDIQAVNG